MITLTLLPIIIFAMVLTQGFFANSEMSIVSSNKLHLSFQAKNGDRRASIINNFLNKPNKLFGTTLSGINLATVISSILTEYYFENYIAVIFPHIEHFISLEILILIIIEPVILIFGELFPMAIARKYPNTTALRNSYIIYSAYFILFPIRIIPDFISKMVEKLFKQKKHGKLSREELQLMVTGRYSNINYKTQEFINEAFHIRELIAEDVMTHLDKVNAVREDVNIEKIKDVINDSNHSRIPVFRNYIYNIIGTVHASSILGADDKENITEYIDKLYIVPSSKPIIQILKEFRTNRKYMGIVVDEYGAVCGIITLEDILEEIVGEINDEYDKPVNKAHPESLNVFLTDIRLDDFYERTGINLTDSNAETLSGAINFYAGRIPRTGEIIQCKKSKFKIMEATDRVVKKIKLISKN